MVNNYIYLTARRVSSHRNVTADALSRFHDLNCAAVAHAMLEQRCGINIAESISSYSITCHVTASNLCYRSGSDSNVATE